jgi:hypothetical protein
MFPGKQTACQATNDLLAPPRQAPQVPPPMGRETMPEVIHYFIGFSLGLTEEEIKGMDEIVLEWVE